jgi:hypothetical protein
MGSYEYGIPLVNIIGSHIGGKTDGKKQIKYGPIKIFPQIYLEMGNKTQISFLQKKSAEQAFEILSC